MELAQPVERVREQEVAHLVAAEVEDQRAPVGMGAAARVLVLVQRRPVEAREREIVAREVRGHPVEDDADPGLVERVDERAEVVRLAQRRDGRVEAGHLVAPRARERVVHHRQELDVGEAEVADVGDELLGELLPAEPEPPRARVHLVDRDRLLQLVEAAAPLEPVVVGPLVAGAVDPRGRLRRDLGVEGERVGLQAQLPVGAVHLELVRVPLGRLGHDRRPDPGRALRLERLRAPVPEVPVADDGDAARVRRPDRERDALVGHVRAEALVDPLVPALAGEMQVELARASLLLQHAEDPRDRDRDPVGPVVQLVAELVDGLLELEDRQQPLDLVAARRQQRRIGRVEVAVEELRPAALLPVRRADRRCAGSSRPRRRTRTSAASPRRRGAVRSCGAVRGPSAPARPRSRGSASRPRPSRAPGRGGSRRACGSRGRRGRCSSAGGGGRAPPRRGRGRARAPAISGSAAKTCSISSSIDADRSASASVLGSSGAKCGSAGSDASALCRNAVTSPSRRACSGIQSGSPPASVSSASSQPSPLAGTNSCRIASVASSGRPS